MTSDDAPSPAPASPPDGDAADDPELRAAKALHEKIQGARKRASLTSLAVGLVIGVVLAVGGQGVFAERLGPHIGTLAIVVVFFAPILGALKLAEKIADMTVRQQVGGWITAIAKSHGVAESTLEDHARIAGAKDA